MPIFGDINNDGVISGSDVVYLASYISGIPGFTLEIPAFNYGIYGSWAVMSITGNYGSNSGQSLADAIIATGWTDFHNLKIIGIGNNAVWNDFQFSYGEQGKPNKLHIENISLNTTSIDGYAVYSKDTLTTMKDVNISGYSGADPSQTGGGAMRLRAADYSGENHSASNPTLSNVVITNCCRGIRIQDSVGAYVKDCNVSNVTDNGVYFAAGSYTSGDGCINCVADNCSVTTAGQVAFMNIGGANNKFINCDMSGSRGAAVGIWNTNGNIEVDNCSFTNANTSETQTPWGGNTDEFDGAAAGLSVATGDVSGHLLIKNCTFNSGAGSVYFNKNGTMEVLNNTVTLENFSGGLVATASDLVIGTDSNTVIS